MLQFYKVTITKAELIKTLSTFSILALILSEQYRLEYNACQVTYSVFCKLVAEKHDTIILNNNSRPTETKKVP